jgi:hypothetical protein
MDSSPYSRNKNIKICKHENTFLSSIKTENTAGKVRLTTLFKNCTVHRLYRKKNADQNCRFYCTMPTVLNAVCEEGNSHKSNASFCLSNCPSPPGSSHK